MKIVKENAKVVPIACAALRSGGLVIFPTETVYGIGADATNEKAIYKLNQYKQRPLGKPYSIAVTNQKMAEKYVELNSTAKKLYQEFLPGPVTVVSKGRGRVAPGVESETGTLGIRIPDYSLVIKIVEKLGKPITATSANSSYKKRPYKISDVLGNISKKQRGLIDLVIDAGELPRNEPSTVVDTTPDDLVVLRQGDIKFKSKNTVLSRSEEDTQNTAKELWQKYEKYIGKRPIIFALEGPMGVGKTQFIKGLARAMDIKDQIVSPSFALVINYKSGATAGSRLTHIDAWRMRDSEELKALEFNKYATDKDNVTAIEWADRVVDAIRVRSHDAVIIWIKIDYTKDENERIISWNIV